MTNNNRHLSLFALGVLIATAGLITLLVIGVKAMTAPSARSCSYSEVGI